MGWQDDAAASRQGSNQCALCHWHMEGATVREDGRVGTPVWCGAGNDDRFLTGRTCVSRLGFVELYFEFDDENPVTEYVDGDEGPSLEFREGVREWIEHNIPKTIIEPYDTQRRRSATVEDEWIDFVLSYWVKFDSEEDFVLFKLFWL